MKKCPSCNKTYDDSWGVCLQCETPLEQTDATGRVDAASNVHGSSLGSNFIAKQINRTNRSVLITNIGVIVGIIFICINQNLKEAGYWIFVPIGLVALSCWNITQVIRRIKNPSVHPISKKIIKYGPLKDLVSIIDKEVEKGKEYSVAGTIFTQSWMLKPTFFNLTIVHMGEIVWIYNKSTTNYRNGIQTGTTVTTMIHGRDGNSYELPGNQFAPTVITDVIKSRAPWVISGYSDELSALWSSKRSDFLAAVDQNKREKIESKTKTSGDSDDR